ncbi:hypothetical protein [Methylorubrum extorquens]|uniref:hypothetical protein n=1 Tax=Methylorubrum extorquens TaxID=408 RepID=UPI0020A02634|nr:hypothetical protein [Methylorubrum extorquens]MCP1539537.1 hypothetical protein [Methylorubrum extorquens]
MLRVRSLTTYGSVFEILEDRFDSSVIEASPASAANFSASDAWADYGSVDFVASGRSLLA